MAASPYVDLDRPPLREAALRRALVSPGSFVRDLRVVERTGSTNVDLAGRAHAGAREGTVLIAEYQAAGQGRLDRGWTSPPRAGLTMSVLLRPDGVPARRWSWLPLLVGCAVTAAVDRAANLPEGARTALKWPNDVLLGERKICGILLQRVETPTGPAAVVGIGLNVSLCAEELPDARATSLALAGHATDRDTLARTLLRTLGALYLAWHDAGGDPDRGLGDAYRVRCATLGRDVRVALTPDDWISGEALDVDEEGRLVVRTDDGMSAWSAGDVHHVR